MKTATSTGVKLGIIAVALLFGAFQSFAGQLRSAPAVSDPMANPSVMRTAGRTTQPIGHYEYCKNNVADCNIRASGTKPTRLTRKRWNEMLEVNTQANASIMPITDMEYYGVEEIWSLPDSFGDCEDYVLLKRQNLIAKGWPASSLLITVVRRTNGDGHAVLTVRTDKGDFILDNLEDRVEPWDHTGYTYLKRVSAANSGIWEDIVDTRHAEQIVGSVK